MLGENSPPGEYSPPEAGANNSVRHLVRHRAAWIKPSTQAPEGADSL